MAWPVSTGRQPTCATRAAALEDRLATAPATTAADVAVKVRRLLASALAGGDGREAALAPGLFSSVILAGRGQGDGRG